MKKMIMITIFLLVSLKLIAPVDDRAVILKPQILFDKYELSWYSIDYWMNVFDIQNKEIVKRQIRLETANLTSRICMECNNLFGMKKARKRQTTAIGKERNGTAVYLDFRDSIKDYAIWQAYFYSGGDYYTFLKSHGYATDIYYVSKLKRL